jgi:hypothetical protein
MKYVVEMVSGAMIYSYIPSFIKFVSGIQRFIGGIHRHTDTTVISSAYFIFQNKESRLKIFNSIVFREEKNNLADHTVRTTILIDLNT